VNDRLSPIGRRLRCSNCRRHRTISLWWHDSGTRLCAACAKDGALLLQLSARVPTRDACPACGLPDAQHARSMLFGLPALICPVATP
jgi:hypothetical protein